MTMSRPSKLSLLVLLSAHLVLTDAAEKCSNACPKNIAPVCGSNGQTYDNKCLFEYAKCSTNNASLTITKQGECDASSGSSTGGKCSNACPKIMAPVCASNGQTYDNKCLFEYANCSTNSTTLTITKQGECSGSSSGGGNSTCSDICPELYEPVCGTDGKTYTNECRLVYARCSKQSPNVQIASAGSCKGSQTSSQHGSAACSEDCPRDRIPVCGSDGVTYANECLLKYAACSKGSITKASNGECAGGASRSPQNSSGNASTAPTPAPTKSQSASVAVPTVVILFASILLALA